MLGRICVASAMLPVQLLKGKPLYSTFFVSNKCNSRCSFCNVWKGSRQEMSLQEIDLCLERLKALGVRFITLTGGEPLLRQDLQEILDLVEEKRFVYTLVTNGTLLNERRLADFRKRKMLSLSISLDSLKRETYKSIRGIDKLPTVLENLEIVGQTKFKHLFPCTLTTVNSLNIGEVFEIISFAKQNSLHTAFGPVSVGMGYSFRSDQGALVKESFRKKAAQTFKKIAEMCKKERAIVGPSLFYENISQYFLGRYSVPCDAGKLYMSIDSRGNISVCQDFEPIGNILHKEPAKILAGHSQQQAIKECASNTPCFYGCTTYLSMIDRASIMEKAGIGLEGFWKEIVPALKAGLRS